LSSRRGPNGSWLLGGGVNAEKFIQMFKQNTFFISGCGDIYFASELDALPGARAVLGGPHERALNLPGMKFVTGQQPTATAAGARRMGTRSGCSKSKSVSYSFGLDENF